MPDSPLHVCLERDVELASVRLHFREWPGYEGPLVYLGSGDALSSLAPLAPRYRVIRLELRTDRPYQTQACDVAEFLQQFGFVHAVLLGEGVGALIAQLTSAWFFDLVAGLVLVDRSLDADPSTLLGKSLRSAPPDLSALSIACPVLELPALDVAAIEEFLGTC